MKKKLILLAILSVVLLSSLSSRPQLYVGWGLGWSRKSIGGSQAEALEGNRRFLDGDFDYFSVIGARGEVIYMPSRTLGLTLNAEVEVDNVLSLSQDGNGTGLRYGIPYDALLEMKVGAGWLGEADMENHFALGGKVLAAFSVNALSRDGRADGERDVFTSSGILASLSLLQRYDSWYFKFDCGAFKDFSSSRINPSFSVTFGAVWTVLKENQYMSL